MILKLINNLQTIIDDDDFDKVAMYKWNLVKGYLATRINGTFVSLHRLISNAPNNLQVDHINGNTLDNRKCNLRFCSNQQNSFNRPKNRVSTSNYKGVSWFKRDNKWRARIAYNGRQIHLGYFNNEKEAAIMYNLAAKQMFGEFARLNVLRSTIACAS